MPNPASTPSYQRLAMNYVRKAMYDRMKDDSALMADVVGIYDRPPQGTNFPYVTFTRISSEPDRTHDNPADKVYVTLGVHTSVHGFEVAEKICDHIQRLFGDRCDLEVENYHTVAVRYESAETVDPEINPDVRAVMLLYQVYVKERQD